jgi:hypothetical protein
MDHSAWRRISTADDLLHTLTGKTMVQLHDIVALLEDVPTTHFETGHPLLLRRGQIGTVVLQYENGVCELEFADRDGRAYGLLPVPEDKLMVLHDTPEPAVA